LAAYFNFFVSKRRSGKEDPGNYRLVSLTSTPGNLMEQLILKVIIKQGKGSYQE